ncbi:putative ankyrin repeat-containing domain-containing protein [Plasmopara halstedii]
MLKPSEARQKDSSLCIGADASLFNANGQIPLHFHRDKLNNVVAWRQEIAELLVDYSRDMNHADIIGSTPLMRAIYGEPNPGLCLFH